MENNKKKWKTCPIRYKMYYDAMQISSMILAQKKDNYTKDIKYNPKKKTLEKDSLVNSVYDKGDISTQWRQEGLFHKQCSETGYHLKIK